MNKLSTFDKVVSLLMLINFNNVLFTNQILLASDDAYRKYEETMVRPSLIQRRIRLKSQNRVLSKMDIEYSKKDNFYLTKTQEALVYDKYENKLDYKKTELKNHTIQNNENDICVKNCTLDPIKAKPVKKIYKEKVNVYRKNTDDKQFIKQRPFRIKSNVFNYDKQKKINNIRNEIKINHKLSYINYDKNKEIFSKLKNLNHNNINCTNRI